MEVLNLHDHADCCFSQSFSMTNHHRIDSIELGATDMAASKAFYTAAFGWPLTDYGPDSAIFDDGRLSGGVTTHAEKLT